MKKFLLSIILLMVFSVGASFANEYDHKIIIEIEDESGNLIDIDTVKYTFLTGDSSVSGGSISKGRKIGQGLWDVIDTEYDGTTFNFLTNGSDDIDFVLYDDTEQFAYHIVERIKKEDYAGLEEYKLLFKLSELKQVEFKATLDNSSKGDFELCLFKNYNPGRPNRDNIRYSWIDLSENPSKKIYLSEGSYDPIVVHTLGSVKSIFEGSIFNTGTTSQVSLNGKSSKLKIYDISVQDSYEEYEYLGLQATTKSSEYFHYWTLIKEGNMTLQIEDGLFSYFQQLYISNTANSIYEKCISFNEVKSLNLSDYYYYSSFEASKHGENIFLDTELTDMNGNVLTPIGTDFENDVIMEIYDSKDELVGKQVFSSYWTYFKIELDNNISYTAKVYSKVDPHVVTISYFDVLVVDGLPTFDYLNIENIDISQTHPMTVDFFDNQYIVKATLTNESPKSREYKVIAKGAEETVLDTYVLKSGEVKEKYFTFTREELAKDLELIVAVTVGESLYNSIIISSANASDIEGHWANKTINSLLIKNIIFNRGENEFCPNDYISRAEFSAFLSLALELEDGEIVKNFIDMNESSALYNFVVKASSNGLISGYPDGSFKPDYNIKRQDLAIVIKKGLELKGLSLPVESKSSNFLDGNQVDQYAMNGVDYCVTNNILSGKPGGLFDPQAFLTRAEAAVVINKIIELLK
ncbi:MAG: S-layer homology domain-containing protein [Clostridiales bacterium]|nr:S-layer homology domain-containing protein [Clostridiales bacterium]